MDRLSSPTSLPVPVLILALAGVVAGCGGTQAPAEAEPVEEGHAGHAGHEGHEGHAGHGGHDHSSPGALGPLMRELRGKMLEMRVALVAEDAASIAAPAQAVAVACDDQDVHDLDPEQFGPRFAEIDALLHGASAELSGAASEGDLERSRELYETVLTHCGDCHAQAPSAGQVDLTELALP